MRGVVEARREWPVCTRVRLRRVRVRVLLIATN